MIQPYRTYNDHALPITNVKISMTGRLYSCSLDRTCKVYDIQSDISLFSLLYPVSLMSLAFDPLESQLFVGGNDGRIFVIDLSAVAIAKMSSNATILFSNAINFDRNIQGGAGAGGTVMNFDSANANPTSSNLSNLKGSTHASLSEMLGHSNSITSMEVTWDGCHLLSSSQDGSIRTWNLSSRQCIRKITLPDNLLTKNSRNRQNSSMGQIMIIPRPSTKMKAQGYQKNKTIFYQPIQPFKKYTSSIPN